MQQRFKILLVSPEIKPFAATGGLADMVAALAKALHRIGHDVRLIMPRYKSTAQDRFGIRPIEADVDVPVGAQTLKAEIHEGRLADSIPVYLVGKERYFWRDDLYTEQGRDFPDNAERFIFFCRAALETCKALDFQPDIIHCSDWQTGLVPAYLKTLYREDAFFRDTRTLLSIHNLGYQGNFWNFDLPLANLPWDIFTPEGVEFYGMFSFLKAGIVYSDILTTVSPSYSKEILTQDFGFRMEGVLQLRAQDLHGILNGVDYDEWDPQRDPLIEKNYAPDSMAGKAVCKRDLLAKLSLKADARTPLLCMITRLSLQKGIDLVLDNMGKILATGAVVVILGTGEPRFEKLCAKLAKRHRGSFACVMGFNETLSHRIFSASDFILVPSRYEPCGLTQMYALRYGTAPIVRAVGGLQDSVTEFDPETGQGTGFRFDRFDIAALITSLDKAVAVYRNEKHWRQVTRNAMSADHSWSDAARQYSRLYAKVLGREMEKKR
jgi:starch synthase